MNSGKADGHRQAGWDSSFCHFATTGKSEIISALRSFVREDLDNEVSDGQDRAWKDSVPKLQYRVNEIRKVEVGSQDYGVILEYQLPMEFRRPDGVLLLDSSVVVLEFKGRPAQRSAAVDQVHAYARDLRLYHRECHDRRVHPVLVDMSKKGGGSDVERGVMVCGPDALDDLILDMDDKSDGEPLDRGKFLAESAYCPLPSLITAARELFNSRKVRRIWRASDNTDKALERLLSIVDEARASNERRLALVSGVPGSGKTLVGLRLVCHEELELGADSDSGIPSVFLSGNGPLCSVLNHEFKQAGGDGRVFIRPIKKYVDKHSKTKRAPDEHVVIYDEAQRAWDKDMVREKQAAKKLKAEPKTEPDLLVEFADRKKTWAVIVGLIGKGQEINKGEEGGFPLWEDALNASGNDWKIHAPAELECHFRGRVENSEFRVEDGLRLGISVRSHLSGVLHDYVDLLLGPCAKTDRLKELARQLQEGGFDFHVTRSEYECEKYLRQRYEGDDHARYGKIVSARAKGTADYGFDNGRMAMLDLSRNPGPWYSDDPDKPASCRQLDRCATEFEIQGLELDATWLAWSSDLVLSGGDKPCWDISRMRKYRVKNSVKDPLALRVNAYRVLLTRARDACLVYVPEIMDDGEDVLKGTYEFLLKAGMRELLS